MKKSIILFVFIQTLMISAQNRLESGKTYNQVIIESKGYPIEAYYFILKSDTLFYQAKNGTGMQKMSLADVDLIQKQISTKSNSGKIIGGIVGLVGGIAYAASTVHTETDGMFEVTTMDTWPIYVFGLVGIALGYAIDESAEEWETIYNKSSPHISFIPFSSNGTRGCQLAVHYKF
ncbi:MAG: hypothetical protein K9I69_02915 [Ignavibacteriales bacterium]|nr:hypothetical protein [Ignavibacteriales bacterium]MCF8306534.1 hypothetical protein [Ignavibacteriales bacterium]MCF8316333.1 hypothetical protein [Ignavibacteriales bacterium]MCF8437709.1 hypothetical protein [Ignavibacteriales bacterium]